MHASDLVLCPHCTDSFKSTGPALSVKQPVLIWEQPQKYSIIKIFISTIKETLFHPTPFFSKITEKSNLFYALLFGLAASSLGILGDFFGQRYLISLYHLSSIYSFDSAQVLDSASSLIFAPGISIFAIFMMASYIHGMLVITRSRRQSFKSTVIAVCYMQSASLFSIIPFAGFLLSLFWYIFLIVTGVSTVHATTRLRATIITFLPLFLVVALLSVLTIVLLGGVILVSMLLQKYPLFLNQ